MSTYREIHGKAVKSLDTDPSATTDAGQIWYNTGSDTFKSIVDVAAWSSASPMSTARFGLSGFGTQTAAAGAGGYIPPNSAATEEYNGSGWAAGGNLGAARRYLSGFGTQTAGAVCGGFTTTDVTSTEEYDGSSWTAGGALNQAIRHNAASGTQTAGLAFAGNYNASPPFTIEDRSDEYNGTSWTASGDMNTGRAVLMGCGIQTSTIAFGGGPETGPAVTATEDYNGSSWTTVNSMNTSRQDAVGCGTTSSAITSNGNTPPISATSEEWNGTSWSTAPSMATARRALRSAGASYSSALGFGGTPPTTGNTEEFNKLANVITAAAWASGGNLSTIGRYSGANAGTKNAALYAGGYAHPLPSPSYPNSTEEYNGSSWSSGGNLSNLGQGTGSAGTQTACWATGRSPNSSPTGPTVATEEYDGSSWTAGGSLNTSQGGSSGCGTLTAGSYARGGQDHENYNGTAWTAATDSPSPQRGGAKQAGTQTANIYFGGEIPGGTYINATLEWDGSSWTSGGNLLINSAGYGGGIGTQTAAMQAQGYSPATSPNRMKEVSAYDGSSWSSRPSLSTGRSDGGNSSASPSTDCITFSGAVPPVSTATEEFTGETTAINVKTLTQS